ncbi:fatty-acid-binding protein 1 [Cajanus cajan]|uniref:fatty-acid-binding protein 1 n=1 Tax=Cajanus cajan TaxID=3821 RepID=UPI00098DC106|nr:fatty-acid-binding protein 1 [Cajanus cajan]
MSSSISSHSSLSLNLEDNGVYVLEKRSGVSFPSILGPSLKLCGVGLRKKSLIPFISFDVYAFGVYAADEDIKQYLSWKYRKFSASKLQGKKEFIDDLMESDIFMAIRLQIIHGGLSIPKVRNVFEESVGSRLQKFGGSDNKELLQRFTSQFRDEYKIPCGSVIHLLREKGHVLHTLIDGQEVGSIQSKLLCKSILDLYVGEEVFDEPAKEEIENNVATYLRC